jgi:hypothetical protein
METCRKRRNYGGREGDKKSEDQDGGRREGGIKVRTRRISKEESV